MVRCEKVNSIWLNDTVDHKNSKIIAKVFCVSHEYLVHRDVCKILCNFFRKCLLFILWQFVNCALECVTQLVTRSQQICELLGLCQQRSVLISPFLQVRWWFSVRQYWSVSLLPSHHTALIECMHSVMMSLCVVCWCIRRERFCREVHRASERPKGSEPGQEKHSLFCEIYFIHCCRVVYK